MTSDETVYTATSANRRLTADFLESLDEAQWAVPSLCAGWTVHQVAAHLLQPMLIGFGRFFLTALRCRGDTSRTVDHLARQLARWPRERIVSEMRGHAGDRVSPPRVGPMGPFADTCIHLRDMARPLGAAADVPPGHWRLLLGYLAGPSVAPGLVTPGRLDGLRLVATDTDWSAGSGATLSGPAEALAMALAGRPAGLTSLDGPGADLLGQRIRPASGGGT